MEPGEGTSKWIKRKRPEENRLLLIQRLSRMRQNKDESETKVAKSKMKMAQIQATRNGGIARCSVCIQCQ